MRFGITKSRILISSKMLTIESSYRYCWDMINLKTAASFVEIVSEELSQTLAPTTNLDWEMATLGHYGADIGNCLAPLYCPTLDQSNDKTGINKL